MIPPVGQPLQKKFIIARHGPVSRVVEGVEWRCQRGVCGGGGRRPEGGEQGLALAVGRPAHAEKVLAALLDRTPGASWRV